MPHRTHLSQQPANNTAKKALFVVVAVCGLFSLFLAGSPAIFAADQDHADCSKQTSDPVTTLQSPAGRAVRQWYLDGTAAGNLGDIYDNRDRGHSQFNLKLFPQLRPFEYPQYLKDQKLDWGPQLYMQFPHVTVGNSSTSSGITVGSHPRRCMMSSKAMRILYHQYRHSHLYVYPEHRDHDIGHNGSPGYGDLFTANMPYVITSEGSSGSDQPFLQAIVLTLAAFRPEVKTRLVETGLLMPTVQMILRMSSKAVEQEKEYLTGKAHPSAFRREHLDPMKMVTMAHAVEADAIPPLVELSVVSEDRARIGVDQFDAGHAEAMFDTPGAISRVWRSSAGIRTMVLKATVTDANARGTTLHWCVLRGDPDRIRIEPLNEDSTQVRLTIRHHERMPIRPGDRLESNRVDIGVFAHNGGHYSAPSFVSFYTLDNEARTYREDGQPLEIDYEYGETTITPAGGRFHAASWLALLKLACDSSGGLPSSLIRAKLNDVEIPILRRAAEDLSPLAEEQTRLLDSLSIAKAISDKDRKKTVQRELDGVEDAIEAILTCRHDVLDDTTSIEERFQGIVEERLGDPRFYLDRAQQIKDASEHSAKGRASFHRGLNSLLESDIFSERDDGTHVLRPLLPGDAPAEQRLTKAQRARIGRFHAAILQDVLYPGILKAKFQPNFVSPYLSPPKRWRDVYHYTADGTPRGWTRYSSAGRSSFTPDGRLITEISSGGQPQSRYVQYTCRTDAKGRPSGVVWTQSSEEESKPASEQP